MRLKELAWNIRASCRLDSFTLKDEFIHCYGSHDDILDAHGLATAEICSRLKLA
jgi:transketolase